MARKHVEQLVNTHNQAMQNDRDYHTKIELAFGKTKGASQLITNLCLWGRMWLRVCYDCETKGQDGVKQSRLGLVTLVHPSPLV